MFNEYSDYMKKVPGRFIPYLIWIEAIIFNFNWYQKLSINKI